MPSKTGEAERLAAIEQRDEELTGYINRFEAAFDELMETKTRDTETKSTEPAIARIIAKGAVANWPRSTGRLLGRTETVDCADFAQSRRFVL